MKEEWKVFREDKYIYECSTLGRFRRLGKTKYCYLKPYFRNCYETNRNRTHSLIIKVTYSTRKSKEINCKKILAETFIRPLKEDDVVICKNGNKKDMRVANLFITTKSNLGKITGYKACKSKKVIYVDNAGYSFTFRSARFCAKELGFSYQTILDYCHNKVNNPKVNVKFKEEI